MADESPWFNRFAQRERLMAILSRHVRPEVDIKLSDRDFVQAVYERFRVHMAAHIADPNE